MSRQLSVSTSPSGCDAGASQSSPTGGHDSGISCDVSLSPSPNQGRSYSPSNTRKRYPFLLCHSPSLPSIQSSSSLAELDAGSSDSEIVDRRVRVQLSDIRKSDLQQQQGMSRQDEERISSQPHTHTHTSARYYQQLGSEGHGKQSSGKRGDGVSVLHQRTSPVHLIPGTKAIVKRNHNNRVFRRNFSNSGITRRLADLFPAEAERLTRSQSTLVLDLSKHPSGSGDPTHRSVMDRVRRLESAYSPPACSKSYNNKCNPLSRSFSEDQSDSEGVSRYGRHFPVPLKSIQVTGNDNQSLHLFNKLSGRDVSLATVGPDCYVSPDSLICRPGKKYTSINSMKYQQQVMKSHDPDGSIGMSSDQRASSSLLLNTAAKSRRRLILPRIFMMEKALKHKPDHFLLSSASRSTPRRASDPVTELEELVQRLGLDDEDLLDRAERRDLPTRFQLLKTFTSHEETDVKSKDEAAGDRDEGKRLKTPDLIRAPRAPPIRRSAIPDLVHDDVAFRKLRSKKRKSAIDAKSLTSCSPSYMLCSPVFTPCEFVPPPDAGRSVCLQPQPDVDLDDVSYRKITQSEGAKVCQPDPPFGIPKRVLIHSASCDYLNVVVDREDRSRGFYRRKPSKRADRVKDDLAVRCWRRDLVDDEDNEGRSSPLLPVTTHNVLLMNARQRLRPSVSYSSLFYPSFHTSSSNSIQYSSPLIPPPLELDRKRSSSLFHSHENRLSSTHSVTDRASRSPSSMTVSESPFNTMTGCNRSFMDLPHADHDRFHFYPDATASLSSPHLTQIIAPQTSLTQSADPPNPIQGSHRNKWRSGENYPPATAVREKRSHGANVSFGDTGDGNNNNSSNSRMQEMFSVIIADMRTREIFGRRAGESYSGIRRESLL